MFRSFPAAACLLAASLLLPTATRALSLHELRLLANLGTEITVTNEYETFELVELIREEGYQINVLAAGFTGNQLELLAKAGPASFFVDSRTEAFEATRLADIAGGRVLVDAANYSTWDLREMARYGARFEVTRKNDVFQILELLEFAGSRVRIHAEGFTIQDLRTLTQKGARLVYGHQCFDPSHDEAEEKAPQS